VTEHAPKRRFHLGGLQIGRFTPSVVLLIFLPILVLFIGATSLNSRAIFREVLERYQLPSIQSRSREAAVLMLSDLLEPDEGARIFGVGAKVALVKNEASVNYVTVMDAKGALVYDSEGRAVPTDAAVASQTLNLRAPFTRTLNPDSFEYVVPIQRGARVFGLLRVGYSRSSLEEPFQDVKNRVWVTVALIMTLITVLLFSISRWLTKPFREIILDFTKVASRQNLQSRVAENGFGEIRILQKAYNRLKDALEDMQTTQQLLGKYIPPQVAELVLDGRLDVEPRKTRITVLYIDIENFTEYAAYHDVHNVSSMIGDFWAIVEESVGRFQGTVDKHVGDAVICLWNAPLPQPDAASRAVRCLMDIDDRMRAWNVDRQINLREPISTWASIASGSCVVGNMGRRRVEYTALGNTMNIAPRIMSKAHELQARRTMDGFTYEQVADFVDVRDLGKHELRGIRGPIRIYELIGLKKAPSPATVEESKTS
jgi:class 3 adenylate cyclase